MKGDVWATISLENVSVEQLVSELDRISSSSWRHNLCLGIQVGVEDRTETYRRTRQFLEMRSIGDERKLPLGVVAENFGVEIDLSASKNSVGAHYVDVVSDGLAIDLSQRFKTRTMLQLNDQPGPIFMYENGLQVYENISSHEIFLGGRKWQPKIL